MTHLCTGISALLLIVALARPPEGATYYVDDAAGGLAVFCMGR